jgi:hypothetical protein
VNGNNGHDDTDVLYIAFTGDDAVPGKAADWKANSYTDFEASITALGDKLIERLDFGGNSTSSVVQKSTGTSISLRRFKFPKFCISLFDLNWI